jgi:predicted HAD superfamily Cof-like phosphohydrolase
MSQQSNYEAVKEFTEGANNVKCPTTPSPMNKEEVTFCLKMVLSEMTELAQTVTSSHDEAIKLMIECLGTDPSHQPKNDTEEEIIADQADAMVDAWYYMLNCASKKGMDISSVFDRVHEANMNKRDPKTGQFIRRETDGKILKPEGWKPADIVGEIRRQMNRGKKD